MNVKKVFHLQNKTDLFITGDMTYGGVLKSLYKWHFLCLCQFRILYICD